MKRRPYITEKSEQDRFDYWTTRKQDKELDLKMRYSRKQTKNEIESNLDWLCFRDILIMRCNDDARSFAMQDVYWLQRCIEYGVISCEYEEKIDFIEDEIRDIATNDHIDRLRDRLRLGDVEEMRKDLKIAADFYGIEHC